MYSYYKRLKPTWYHVVCFNAFTKSLHKSALNSVHFANNALFGGDGRSRAKECSQHETIVFCVYMHVNVNAFFVVIFVIIHSFTGQFRFTNPMCWKVLRCKVYEKKTPTNERSDENFLRRLFHIQLLAL